MSMKKGNMINSTIFFYNTIIYVNIAYLYIFLLDNIICSFFS